MNEEKRINSYFDGVKQNPPLIEIEKVHQIVTEAKAGKKVKAEVKVEKGHRNLLRFIVMTTVFAIIISAFLFWTRSQEIPSPTAVGTKEPISNGIVQTIDSLPALEKEKIKIEENKSFPVFSNEFKEGQPKAEDTKHESIEIKATESFNEPEPINTSNEVNVEKGTNETIDGNPFIITANKALLEELGFQFRGENVFYQNKSSEGIISVFNCFKVEYDFGTGIFHRTLKDKILEDSIQTNAFDFYPVIVSYKTGKINSSILPDGFNFELVNDTLFPVCIPQGLITDDPNDLIIWFKTSNEFFKRIPENNHPLRKNYDLIKGKKTLKKCNLIEYSPLIVMNQSNFIELTDDELLNLGFNINEISNPLPVKNGESIRTLEISTRTESECIYKDCTKNVTWFNVLWEKIEIGDHKYELRKKNHADETPDLWLTFVSNSAGVIIEEINEVDSLEFVNLIPIKVSKQSFGNIITEDVIFWFRPTNYLFEHLPVEIGSDLRKEYEYVTAEDKSALVKPECKYFDECKNTLDVSSFKVFPNPANSKASVTFRLNESINGKISLVDLAGRERQVLQSQTTFSAGNHRFDFDVRDVPEGIYLIALYSDKGVQTQRLVVTRKW